MRDAEGLPDYAIGMVEDVTERKSAEDALRLLNDELECRVLHRTADIDSANRELEAFSYSVSHDLRAPLRHVTGFVKLVEQHAGASMDEKSRRYARVIADAAQRMGRLIDDLLEFSRTRRAEIDRAELALGVNAYIGKPVDFDQFIGAVRELGLFWLLVSVPPPRVEKEK